MFVYTTQQFSLLLVSASVLTKIRTRCHFCAKLAMSILSTRRAEAMKPTISPEARRLDQRERDGVSHKAAMGKISVINVSATTCVSSIPL